MSKRGRNQGRSSEATGSKSDAAGGTSSSIAESASAGAGVPPDYLELEHADVGEFVCAMTAYQKAEESLLKKLREDMIRAPLLALLTRKGYPSPETTVHSGELDFEASRPRLKITRRPVGPS